MAFFWVLSTRGINIPFTVLDTSSIALASAVAPVVLMLKDCALAVKCKVVAIEKASTKRKNFVMIKQIKLKNKQPFFQEFGMSLMELGLVRWAKKKSKLIKFI